MSEILEEVCHSLLDEVMLKKTVNNEQDVEPITALAEELKASLTKEQGIKIDNLITLCFGQNDLDAFNESVELFKLGFKLCFEILT